MRRHSADAPVSLAASAARGGAITLASQGLKLLLNLGSVVVLARLIEPRYYGLMAMAMAILGVVTILRDFGLSTAALQSRTLTQGQRSNLFWINSGIGLALAGAGFLSSGLIAGFYGEPALSGVVQAVSLTFLLGGISVQFRVTINRELRFGALSFIDLAAFGAGIGVAVVMATMGYKLGALVSQQVVMAAVDLVLSVLFARWLPGLPSRRAPMRELLGFGSSLAVTQVISYFTRNLDSVGIGKVWGAHALGPYDRAYQLMILPLNQINTPMTRVAVPVLARVADDDERYTAYLRRAQLVALYVTATSLGLLAALGPQLVGLLLGPSWSDAGPLVSVLAIGGVFRALVQICYWIYTSRGLAREQLRYFSVAQPLVTVVMLLGLPWGPMGVAIGHSVAFACYWVVSILWATRAAGLAASALFADAARAGGLFAAPGCLLAFVVGRLSLGDGVIGQIVVALAAACCWFALVAIVSRSVRADFSALRQFVMLAARPRRVSVGQH